MSPADSLLPVSLPPEAQPESGRKAPASQPPSPRAELFRSSQRLASAGPCFCRCTAKQVLMRPHMVVPSPKRAELEGEFITVGDRDCVEVLLQGAEETFDPAVLPGAMQFDGLQSDADQANVPRIKREFKQISLSTRMRAGRPYRRNTEMTALRIVRLRLSGSEASSRQARVP